jgi:hypothetical protein
MPRKEINVEALPEVEEEPWLKRRYPHIIAGVVLLFIGSYFYGCTRVMGMSGKLRREIGDVNRILENMNAQGTVVTDAEIIAAVQQVGRKCGVDIEPDEVHILAESLGQEVLPGGVCQMGKMPDSFHLLGPTDQQMIMQTSKHCAAPNWIVTIKVDTKARWGLFSREISATKATWIRFYER